MIRPATAFRFLSPLQFLLAMLILSQAAWAAAPGPGEALAARAVDPATRRTAGKAYVERLGRIYTDSAGIFTAARGGDWRLGNELVTFTFAGVEDLPTSYSMAVKGYEEIGRSADRIPGALIDIATPEANADVIHSFTQGIGLDPKSGITIKYDTVEPVAARDGIGLRLTGTPFENRLMRLETTYWLSAGSHRLRIESRFTDVDPGERIPELVDTADWGVANLIVKGLGFVQDPTDFTTDYFVCDEAGMGLAMAPRVGRMRGKFSSSLSRTLAAAVDQTTRTAQTVYRRDLWLTSGASADALELMFKDKGIPTGTVSGKVTLAGMTSFPPDAKIRIVSNIRNDTKTTRGTMRAITPQTILAYKGINSDGSYRVTLPADEWFFIRGDMRGAHDSTRISLKVERDKNKIQNFQMVERTAFRIQVVDDATSKLMPARLMFEPIYPTPDPFLGFPRSAEGYLNTAYINALGQTVRLSEGGWIIHASHGIEYETVAKQIPLAKGRVQNVVIRLKRVNPTHGWLNVQIGARTDATPGVTISPADAVLMAAAEGIQWIVTSDFERATDLNPVIRDMHLADNLRASVGFRTLLPAHPEWGPFLVYPLAQDAPDPAQAAKQWAKVKSAGEFFSILRRLYPGAIIQCELPVTGSSDMKDDRLGVGYFMGRSADPRYNAFCGPNDKDFDYGFDAVSIVPERVNWDLNYLNTFFKALSIGGHNYVETTMPSSSFVYGAEPGFPRMLVRVGQDNPNKVTEKELFDAFRHQRTQITNGPFIEMTIGGALPGDVIGRDDNKVMKTRVTAAPWVDLTRVQTTKDNNNEQISMMRSGAALQRFPDPAEGQWHERKLEGLRLRDFKDTLLGVSCLGDTSLDKAISRFGGQTTYPYAVISPIVIDVNKNGRFDKLKNYGEAGR